MFMNDSDVIVFEDFISCAGWLSEGPLREKLIKFGFVESNGKILDSERLIRLVRLASAPAAEREAVLQLPPGNPLRNFFENVLKSQNQDGLQLFGILKTHLLRKEKSVKSSLRRTNQSGEGMGFGETLFNRFLNSDFSEGRLGRPTHRPHPERIVWPVKFDLGSGFETHLNESDRCKHDAYLLLAANKPDAAEQVLRLGVAAASIPAMRAWVSRTGAPPSLLQAIFQLHVGKSKLRANLFCSEKSNLLPLFTSRFREVADTLPVPLEIKGPREGMEEVELTFSAARIFLITKPSSPATLDEATRFTETTWFAIKNVLAGLAQHKQ